MTETPIKIPETFVTNNAINHLDTLIELDLTQ